MRKPAFLVGDPIMKHPSVASRGGPPHKSCKEPNKEPLDRYRRARKDYGRRLVVWRKVQKSSPNPDHKPVCREVQEQIHRPSNRVGLKPVEYVPRKKVWQVHELTEAKACRRSRKESIAKLISHSWLVSPRWSRRHLRFFYLIISLLASWQVTAGGGPESQMAEKTND